MQKYTLPQPRSFVIPLKFLNAHRSENLRSQCP
jgi:hypothetical protein